MMTFLTKIMTPEHKVVAMFNKHLLNERRKGVKENRREREAEME